MSEKNDIVTDITHLKAVIMAVFRAEDSIPEHFKERLRTKTDDPEERREKLLGKKINNWDIKDCHLFVLYISNAIAGIAGCELLSILYF